MKPSSASLESVADFLGMTVEDLAATYGDEHPGVLSPVERAAMFGSARAELAASAAARPSDEPSRFAVQLAEESARVAEHDALPDRDRPYVVPGDVLPGERMTCPPHTNRGGKLTVGKGSSYLKLDTLSGTFPAENIDSVCALVGRWLGACEASARGFNGYRESVRWPSSAFVAWSQGRKEALLHLNGDSLDLVAADSIGKLCADLFAFGFKGTRVDAAFTDVERIASMGQVHRAAEAGRFTGFLLTEPRRPKKRGELVGDSRTFGRTGRDGSGCYLIVYDKLLETRAKGEPEIDAIRHEARFYADKAVEAFALLASAPTLDAFRLALGGLVGGCIDYVERDGAHGHLDRMRRLRWWDRILALLGECPVRVDRVVPELPRTLFHFGRQWFGVLHRAIAAYRLRGLDFFDHLRPAVEVYAVNQPDPKLGPFDTVFHADEVFLFLREVGSDALDRIRRDRQRGPDPGLLAAVG